MAAMRRGVKTRVRSPRWRSWSGGSSKMNTPGGISISALMISMTDPLAGAIRLPVDQAALHVVVATERVELVLLVVVERRFVAQPLPDRVRVGVDLEVVGVVVGRVGPDGHGATSELVDRHRPSGWILSSVRCRAPPGGSTDLPMALAPHQACGTTAAPVLVGELRHIDEG